MAPDTGYRFASCAWIPRLRHVPPTRRAQNGSALRARLAGEHTYRKTNIGEIDMPNMRQYEAVVDQIEKDFENGFLTSAEAQEEIHDLDRDFQAGIEEEAMDAAEDVFRSYY